MPDVEQRTRRLNPQLRVLWALVREENAEERRVVSEARDIADRQRRVKWRTEVPTPDHEAHSSTVPAKWKPVSIASLPLAMPAR